ncbi:hypothetical protein BT96DRAFT_923576 [Gymnopus androsaceus JB14]|uniref:F-box domain-containing protein n=1 Tax=Gymnopus androsaceus JB14 TaxID=1447944 RepID=A0A6A4H9I9_9AGAR|nr:hypothetical protein BT96DRAFT_923576 [Gymnopus androsaceus JB14]
MSDRQYHSSWNKDNSPFASLIGTNHIPSSAELNMLKALLVQPQLELCQLEAEIDRVQNLLTGLLSEKQKLTDYIEAHRALISPIRQIPTETLAEIFVWCLPTEPLYAVRNLNAAELHKTSGAAAAPLVFTIISRDWRRVAVSTPRLWNSLHIYLPPHLSRDDFSRRIAGITSWLQRSGSLPISFSIHEARVDYYATNFPVTCSLGIGSSTGHVHPQLDITVRGENMQSMLRALMPFSSRFGDLSLSLSTLSFSFFHQLSPSSFPTLESLHLYDLGTSRGLSQSSESHDKFATLLSSMPVLRKLDLKQFYARDQKYLSLPCNWGTMTRLAIGDGLIPSKALAILAEMPRLQSLSLQITVNEEMSNSVVHLSELREMQLQVQQLGGRHQPISIPVLASLIDCIQSPSLRSLSLTSLSPLTVSEWPFSGVSLHALEILELDGTFLPMVLTECMSQTPNLITFMLTSRFTSFTLQDSHLSCLTSSPCNLSPLWPRLQNIRILTNKHQVMGRQHHSELVSMTSFTNAALITFLESRSQATYPLKYCDVLYSAQSQTSFSEAELYTLRNLKQNGLKLRIYCHPVPANPNIPYHDSPEGGMPRPENITHINVESDMESRYGHGAVVIL